MPSPHKPLITRRRLAWTLSIVLLLLVAMALLVPLAARPYLAKAVSDKLQRPVTIEELAFNPFSFSATLRNVRIGEPQGQESLLSVREMYADLQLRSLWQGAPVIEELKLVQPTVKLVRKPDGSYNISDLIELFSKPSSEPPARYALHNLKLEGGRIEFDDQPMHARHLVSDLNLSVPFFSNLPVASNVLVTPQLSARIDGSPFKLQGQALPFSAHRETNVQFSLQDVDLPGWMKYSPVKPGFALKSGKLQADLTLGFQQADQGGPVVKLSGTAQVQNLDVTELDGKPMLAFKRLAVDLASASLADRRLTLRSVALEEPQLTVVREKNGQLNLQRAASTGKPQQAAAKPGPGQKPAARNTPAAKDADWQVDLAALQVKGGTLDFNDQALAQPFRTRLKDIALTVKEFSTRPDRAFSLDASLATDAGETIRSSGHIRLKPFDAQGKAAITRLDLKRYAPYYAAQAGMVAEQGHLDLSTIYHYQAGTTPQVLLSELAAKLDGLRLRKEAEKAEFLHVGSLAIKGGQLDLAKRSVSAESLQTRDGNVFLAVTDDGQLRLTKVDKPRAFRRALAAEADAAKNQPAPAPTERSKAAAESAPWQYSIKNLAVDGYATRLDSVAKGRASTLALDALQLHAKDFSNQKGSKSQLDLQAKLGKKGHLRADGRVSLAPLAVNLNLNVRGLTLVPFQAWFPDKLNLVLTDGAASTRGRLRLFTRPDNSLRYAFNGDARIDHLATVDKQSKEDILKWRTLRVRQINATSQANSVAIGEVALTDFTTRLVINRDGSLNYQEVLEGDKQKTADANSPAQAPAQAATPAPGQHSSSATLPPKASTAGKPQIKVDKLVLQGGHVDFQDHFIQPNYSAELTQLGGTVTGLSSDPDMLAEIAIKGRVENQGQLDITGKVNPLSGNLYLDLLAKLREFELSPLTPYAAKYVGYGIEKGKMSFDVHYRVQNRVLTADNKLVLNQLTLGERIESPSATKLPVQLALALLKDRNGNIDLDLPISGSLDDPQFSIGGIIVKAIFNLIGRAVTSPFSLIANAFSGSSSGESSHIAFASGSSDLQQDAQDKLQTLAKALLDRPALKLDIRGRADLAYDTEGLKQAALQRKLKAAKMRQLVRQGESSSAAEDRLQITPEEYPRLLARVYAQESFPGKPRNFIGIAKDLPPDQMRALLLQHIAVGEEDVRALGNRRAQEVKDYLVEQGKVPAERLFIVGGSGGSGGEKLPGGRVDLSLGAG